MGGIDTNIDGATKFKGLYAAGECGCVSVHGANRLGGNSLLDTVVFGKRSGAVAAEYVLTKGEEEKQGEAAVVRGVKDVKERIGVLLSSKGEENHSDIRDEMKESMFLNVGIFRTGDGMRAGLEKIRELKERYAKVTVQNKGMRYNVDLIRALELEGMLDVAEAIATGALKREESRGAHSRLDFKERDDERFLKHTIAMYSDRGAAIDYSPVTITKFKPEARRY